MPELTEKQLEELVVGKPSRNNATFFEHARLDVPASKQAGRRVYVNTVYIREQPIGVKDSVSRRATEADKKKFAEEWDFFQRNRQGAKRSPKIDIIPNLKLEHMQELIDIGLPTIEMLASAEMVPPHLEYARKSAITLHAVLQQEQSNAEEESIEEIREEVRSAEEGATPDRQQDTDAVLRRAVPRSQGDDGGEAGEGHGQDRRPQHHLSEVNWEASFRIM